MTRIDPIQWTEKTALRERDQLRTAVNMLIESINGTAGDADRAEQAAIAAKTQAELAAHDANDAKASAEQAVIEAGKVNQFDARIKGNMKDVSYAPTATEVTAVIMKEDGTIIDRPIPTLDHDRAGMMTPAQMKDISDHLDSLGREQNTIKTEYLKRHAIHEEQDITGRVDFKISPYVPTLKSNEYADRNGTRAYNAASAAADPVLMKTVGVQNVNARILNKNFSSKVISDLDISAPPERIQATYDSVVDDTVNHNNIINHVVVRNASAYIDQMYIRNENGPSDVMLSVISYHDGTCEMTLKRPNGTTVKIVERG